MSIQQFFGFWDIADPYVDIEILFLFFFITSATSIFQNEIHIHLPYIWSYINKFTFFYNRIKHLKIQTQTQQYIHKILKHKSGLHTNFFSYLPFGQVKSSLSDFYLPEEKNLLAQK